MQKFSHYTIAAMAMSACMGISACDKEPSIAQSNAPDQVAAVDSQAKPSKPVEAQPAQSTPAVPADSAQKYDGKIVHQPDAKRGKDDGWFLVKDGKRRWITEASWLELNGYHPSEVIYISSDEFNSIPEDPRPLPDSQ